MTTLPKNLLPFPSLYNFELSGKSKGLLEKAIEKIHIEFSSLRYFYHTWKSKQSCVGYAMEDVWSRKARRKFSREHPQDDRLHSDGNGDRNIGNKGGMGVEIEEAALGFRIDLSLQADGSVDLNVRWLKGADQVLFESFCGMLKRKVAEEIQT